MTFGKWIHDLDEFQLLLLEIGFWHGESCYYRMHVTQTDACTRACVTDTIVTSLWGWPQSFCPLDVSHAFLIFYLDEAPLLQDEDEDESSDVITAVYPVPQPPSHTPKKAMNFIKAALLPGVIPVSILQVFCFCRYIIYFSVILPASPLILFQLWLSVITGSCHLLNIYFNSSDFLKTYLWLTCNAMWVYVMAIPSVRPAGVVKNFNVGYISLNIRGRLLIFGIHIDHMDL